MKKFVKFYKIFSIILIICLIIAGGFWLFNLFKFKSVESAPDITYIRSNGSSGDSTTLDIGSPGTDRLVVVIAGDEYTGAYLSGVTVDGNNCNLVINADNPQGAGNIQEMWYCDEDDLGSSNGVVNVVLGDCGATCAVHAHLYTGVDQNGPTDSGIDDTSTSSTTVTVTGIDVPANGLVVMGAGQGNGGSYVVNSWTSPLIERTDGPDPNSAGLYTASGIESTQQTNKTYIATFDLGFNRGTATLGVWPEASGAVPSMVAHWQLDDGSGTTAIDSSGNGNNGTLVNGPIWTTGRINGALDFDGVYDYVTVGNDDSLNFDNGFTVVTWFNSRDVSTMQTLYYSYLDGSNVIQFRVFNNRLQVRTERSVDWTDYLYVTGSTALLNNTWYHAAFVLNESRDTLTLYLNGVFDNSSSGTAVEPFSALYTDIGGRTQSFNGMIDDVRVYNYALGGSDILNLYNSAADSTPPDRSNGSPSGSLPSGTASTTISLDTDENATCKYDTTPGTAYAAMANTFSATGGTSHSTTVSGLSDGNSYTYYIRCEDGLGNVNSDDFSILFSVDTPAPDVTPPQVTSFDVNPTTTTDTTTISWTVTDDVALDQVEVWRTIDNGGVPDPANWIQIHSEAASGVSDTGSYVDTPPGIGIYWYGVHALDQSGNMGIEAAPLAVTVEAADSTPPDRSNGSPSGSLPSGTASTTISLDTDENATCKYDTTPGTAYAAMANTFSATGGTSHSTTVSGLSDGNSYTYYIRCEDGLGNANSDDFLISFSVASAAAQTPVTGWAWSSTIGWISLDGTNYQVNIDQGNGNFSGWAWSSNIGWIDFSPNAGFPAAPAYSARYNSVNGEVNGWARAWICASDPVGCDGWDGWILLGNEGNTWPEQVSYDSGTGALTGWAWGGRDTNGDAGVAGWISFNASAVPSNNPPTAIPNPAGIPNYCISTPVAIILSWQFSDSDLGDTQSAYQIQVTRVRDGQVYDSGKLMRDSTSHTAFEINTDMGGNFIWYDPTDQGYTWRVMVWDSSDTPSVWANGPLFDTPLHSYPRWLNGSFSWQPLIPAILEGVHFSDDATCYDDGGDCSGSLGGIDSFSWTFDSGSPPTSFIENPTTSFGTTGPKQVTLIVTDSDGYSCPQTDTVNTSLSLPQWKEIKPW